MREFEDQVAWLAVNTSKTAVAELMRVAWRTVGGICERVVAEAQREVDLLDGLTRIGIDEVGYPFQYPDRCSAWRRCRNPAAGVDYPSNWHELLAWFPDDAACLRYLEDLRWRDGFVCRLCAVVDGGWWQMGDGLRRCRVCRRETSVTSGTIFARARTPLTIWFAAVWYVVNQKQGVSALGLQRVLGLGSYETAWAWLHKLRRAMVRPGRELLPGPVEIDETIIGGIKPTPTLKASSPSFAAPASSPSASCTRSGSASNFGLADRVGPVVYVPYGGSPRLECMTRTRHAASSSGRGGRTATTSSSTSYGTTSTASAQPPGR